MVLAMCHALTARGYVPSYDRAELRESRFVDAQDFQQEPEFAE